MTHMGEVVHRALHADEGVPGTAGVARMDDLDPAFITIKHGFQSR